MLDIGLGHMEVPHHAGAGGNLLPLRIRSAFYFPVFEESGWHKILYTLCEHAWQKS